MKIGILTFHKAYNYGALLQAVALRHYLLQYSEEVYYIDYNPSYLSNESNLISSQKLKKLNIKGKISTLCDTLIHLSEIKARNHNFEKFIQERIAPFCKPLTEDYDLIFYGSDQIWRKTPSVNGYDRVFWGCNIRSKHKVTYAASMGNIETLPEELDIIKELINNFDLISVRETNVQSFLKQLCDREIYQVLDPTLLLNNNEWDRCLPASYNKTNSFVLFYDLRNNSLREDDVYKYAERNGMLVEHLVGSVMKKSKREKASKDGPYDFFLKIKNADFVFTSSFHGVALSIVFNKQFVASFNDNSGRALSLLQSLGIENRLLFPNSCMPESFVPINYNDVNLKLRKLQNKSYDFIKKCILIAENNN